MSRFLPLALLVWAGCLPPKESGQVVTFEIDLTEEIEQQRFNPDTHQIGVRGSVDPLSWAESVLAMDPDGDGMYQVDVRFAAAADSIVQYKYKIERESAPDDGWEDDRNRRVDLRSKSDRVSRLFNAPPPELPASFSGDIREHADFPSSFLGRLRDIWVYLPPGYTESDSLRYPVLYMHDGQHIFDGREAGAEWGMDEAAERMITSGDMEPVIIVGVGNTRARTEEYTPSSSNWRYMLVREEGSGPGLVGTFAVEGEEDGLILRVRLQNDAYEVMLPDSDFWQSLEMQDDGTYLIDGPDITLMITDVTGGLPQRVLATREASGGGGIAYGRFLTQELKPFIDETYRTRPEREFTSVGGASLGGLISMYFGVEHADTFSGLLVASPSVWWDDEAILEIVEQAEKPAVQRIWLDVGTQEGSGMVRGARRLRDLLQEEGWSLGDDLIYREEEGAAHSESAWARRAPDMLKFLYGQTPAGMTGS